MSTQLFSGAPLYFALAPCTVIVLFSLYITTKFATLDSQHSAATLNTRQLMTIPVLTVPNNPQQTPLSHLLSHPTGAIFGNPLLYPKCTDSLLKAHQITPQLIQQRLIDHPRIEHPNMKLNPASFFLIFCRWIANKLKN